MLRKELEAGFSDNNRPISTTTAQDDASELLPLPMRVKTILGIALTVTQEICYSL